MKNIFFKSFIAVLKPERKAGSAWDWRSAKALWKPTAAKYGPKPDGMAALLFISPSL